MHLDLYFLFSPQISFLAHVPPLGFGVYQLLEGPSLETVLADYNLYHNDKAKLVKTDRVFNVKEIQNALDEIMLENIYMKIWFSGNSGLVEVCVLQNICKYCGIQMKMQHMDLINFFSLLESEYKRR